MEWIYQVFVDPYDYPIGWFAYLAMPIISTALIAWIFPTLSKTVLVALCVSASILVYFSLYVVLYGMSSTIGIGVMFALVVYLVVSATTASVVRGVMRAVRRRPTNP